MIFRFKQFSVDQSGCAMKINTDGVLLGALTKANHPSSILDIGAGTGVIALMLAQRFPQAIIDAVEIDPTAAQTAEKNFNDSTFRNRLSIYPLGFEQFFELHPYKKYGLIVSNPPFYINSLRSPKAKVGLAKHTDEDFFARLITIMSRHLLENGICVLILPIDTADIVKNLAAQHHLLVHQTIAIRSYPNNQPHRVIIALGFAKTFPVFDDFVIYDEPNKHSTQYRDALKDFFTIF